jgi:hypothetical protein
MNSQPIILIIIALVAWGCNDHETDVKESVDEITMDGMDQVTKGGGTLQVVVRSQEEYDTLIYDRYTRPLQEYWDKYYASTLESIKSRYPNRSDLEYAELVKQSFYSVYPFKGTEGYAHPKIDFSQYSLLGQSTFAGGNTIPTYKITITRNDNTKSVVFKIVIIRSQGTSDMGWDKNIWILVHKIPVDIRCNLKRNKRVGPISEKPA